MGNKLSCSCAPLIRKAYRYEDSPWQNTKRRDGHLLRLWAEVFHVSASSGTVKWQQVSEDLVPVNITCIQDTPECIFHITAYNSQVVKILDVRLVQPGTRLGQASECFVYWKDSSTGDTWGLNFTSPVDAKQFRECCSPSFKFARKASSSYSLKLEPPKNQQKSKGKKTQSTPSSPSRGREPQCTCMTAENLHRARNGRVRYTGGAATLPRAQSRAEGESNATYDRGRLSSHPSTTSVYDNVGSSSLKRGTTTASVHGQSKTTKGEASQKSSQASDSRLTSNSRSNQARAQYAQSSRNQQTKSIDCSSISLERQSSNKTEEIQPSSRTKSKSSNDVNQQAQGGDLTDLNLDSNTLKRMLHPLPSKSSVQSSPDQDTQTTKTASTRGSRKDEGEESRVRSVSVPRCQSSKSAVRDKSNRSETGRRRSLERTVCLDLTDGEQSPPSDNFLYDNLCYATTPSSSNENSDAPYLSSDEGGQTSGTQQEAPTSPTSKLLMEYEKHLRNALARGLDAESYSLQTFEALLSHSMENVVALMREVNVELEAIRREETALKLQSHLQDGNRGLWNPRSFSGGKSNTLPFTHPSSGRQLSAGSSVSVANSTVGGTRDPSPSFCGQHSLESTDSRIYLTSSEMSDDDRLSLTTAVSDEEDAETRNSPFRSRSGTAAASFNCTGAVRKAGFLSVKKWLLRKHRQVELAKKRGWKGYWVSLKGTTLLFYPCDNRDGRAIENTPKHLIIVDGAIMQPIPEHPKRDYIFCLSTAFGDAYLFQAPCQVELENWINSIHSACAAAFARHRGKTGTLHLLQEEVFRLEKEIESDGKVKHMAELQLTVVGDSDSKHAITTQITQREENLERLHCEQFRLRCYMASLQNSELPNPKNLLTNVCKMTKSTLNKLGVFTVSSFHAYVCARSPSLLTNLLAGRGTTKRRSRGLLSRSNSGRRSLSQSFSTQSSFDQPNDATVTITLPAEESVSIGVRESMTVEEILWSACSKKQLSPNDHFFRAKRKPDDGEYYVPSRHEVVENLEEYEILQVCAKVLYQVDLTRTTLEQLFGFSVEAELVENSDHQDELCVYVSRVEDGSLASQQGLIRGDEIMVINGAIVSDLDMMYIESVLQEETSLCMMMRSSRTEPPDLASVMRTTDDYIESLVCPPPPSDSTLSEEMIGKLIVPSPLWGSQDRSPETSGRPSPSPVVIQETSTLSTEQIEGLLKVIEDSRKKPTLPVQATEQVTEYSRTSLERRRSSLEGSTGSSSSSNQPLGHSRQMPDAEKLRKVIMELIETERTYVRHMSDLVAWYADTLQKHLNSLLEHYLEPMKKESFISNTEITALFGNIQEIVQFQRTFLQSLEEAISAEPDFNTFENSSQFKNVLFAIGNSFLLYADQFKLYSSFCASHSKAQKVLHPGEGNSALMQFLQSRNPKGQHSFSLESYLIKPIQRILKYPLLLQQLKHLTDSSSEEHRHLSEALKGMERVAEHINEMQRIHEEYGAIFDHLYRQHLRSSKQNVDLSPGELLYYGGVEWLNISEFLGKIKKGLELHAMCFVFKTAVVFLCKERIRQKKKLMGSSSKASASEVEIIRYQVLIPVTEVQVRASGFKDGDSHFLWELIHLKSQIQRRSEKIYQLSNSTSDFRNAFLRTIRQIIRESVRNMTVPVNKPGTREKPAVPRKPPELQNMSRTLSSKKSGKTHQRHSAGVVNNEFEIYDNVDQNFRTRSKTVADGMADVTTSGGSALKDLSESRGQSPVPASDRSDKSDKSERSQGSSGNGKTNLGTSKGLSLSTASTLSNSSTGSSSAKLIISSNPPTSYQPPPSEPAGSPVWKPRENSVDKAATLPLPQKGKDTESKDQYFV